MHVCVCGGGGVTHAPCDFGGSPDVCSAIISAFGASALYSFCNHVAIENTLPRSKFLTAGLIFFRVDARFWGEMGRQLVLMHQSAWRSGWR